MQHHAQPKMPPGQGAPVYAQAGQWPEWQEALLSLCLDGAPLGIAMFDCEMRFIAVSRRYRQDLRLGDRPVNGHSVYEIFPEIPERWRNVHRRCLAGATERCDADPFVRADGATEWYRWELRPWHDASGEVAGVVLFSQNITEHQRAELARAESEAAARHSTELLDKTVASMADAVLVLDATGRTLLANPACKALLGEGPDYGSADWQQRMLRYRPDGVTPYRHEETPIGRAVRGESFDNLEVVYRHVGETHGRHLVASGRAVHDRSGARLGSVVVYRDLSELIEKDAAIRRYAEILEQTMASMADAVAIVDMEGRLIFANATTRARLGDRFALGTTDWKDRFDVFAADGTTPKPFAAWAVNRSLRGESVDNEESVLRVRGHDGPIIRIVSSSRPIRDHAGVLSGAVMVTRDVTEIRETERQLRQAQKMDAIGQLTGGVAHELNNILTVITGTIDALIKGVADRPALATIATMIDEAATRGANLTRQLLAFARRQPLQPRQTDVNALVADMARLLGPLLGESIRIETRLGGNAWQAMIDATELSTALLNLAVNARDAMPDGGQLTFETRNIVLDEAYARTHDGVRPGSYVMIAVTDTGTGIPAAIRDKVFEPFFTTKDVGKGAGLGLSMIYGFIKQSNGDVEIDSEEGRGTTIRLYLPRSEVEAAAAEPRATLLTGGSETILAVEDDDLVRNYVLAQLESLGYATLSARNSAEALSLVEQGAEFDLLFTDMIMPAGVSGDQLASEVLKRRPSVKVLYTSGYTDRGVESRAPPDPAVCFLNKPYRKVDLAQKIREALGSRSGLVAAKG